ncbi:MAG: CPBP family intramembrane metalloprotease [Candidatus Eisenbacteria bacterium]|nr:CPBP family intramembrane metalloprotease [Candidatus Eisenbacteria bacterium]
MSGPAAREPAADATVAPVAAGTAPPEWALLPDAPDAAALPPDGHGAPPGPPAHRARLLPWLWILATAGAGALFFGQAETALLVAVAGLFVSAQAADLDERWAGLHRLLAWVVPAGAALVFVALAQVLLTGDLAAPLRLGIGALAFLGAAVSLLAGVPPVADRLARLCFRTPASGHTLRLAAQLVLAGLLLCVPAWFALRQSLDAILERPDAFITPGGLGGGLLGYVVLAFAAVGFLVRRSWPEALERLGLRRFARGNLIVIAAGVAALWLFNGATEGLQKVLFPVLWQADQAFTSALAEHLSMPQLVLLGLSAGIGEEITIRGALQPRLGIVLSSLLFAALHVQYSWYGLVVIFALGLLLGAIRRRAGTTVAMTVHALYDILAVVTATGP